MALLTEREVAKDLGVSVQLLRKWRSDGSGPVYSKFGRLVRYDPSDLKEFVVTKQVKVREVWKEGKCRSTNVVESGGTSSRGVVN